jgi:transposase InsO family protein
MSKARLVLTALFVDRQTPAEVARRYGVHRSWVYRLKARYGAEGEAAFWPRSRRPNRSPTAIPAATVELIVRIRKELAEAGLDAGPDTIAWHLARRHGITVSPATVARYLTRRGLVVPEPAKRPRSFYHRFAAELPNECWQSDVTHYPLADGTEILSWLGDHARYALSVTAHRRVTAPIVAATFAETAAHRGIPASNKGVASVQNSP